MKRFIKNLKKRTSAMLVMLLFTMASSSLPLAQANSTYLLDMDSHWSKEYVNDLVNEGIIDSNKEFYHPDEQINRAEFAKMVVATWGGDFNLSVENNFFRDVNSEWFAKYAVLMEQLGLMTGSSYQDANGNTVYTREFRPAANINRAASATVLARLLYEGDINQYTPASSNPFKDIKANTWYYPSAMWAYDNGIFEGRSSNIFAPEDALTRGEAAKIISQSKAGIKEKIEEKIGEKDSEIIIYTEEKAEDTGVKDENRLHVELNQNTPTSLELTKESEYSLFKFDFISDVDYKLSQVILTRAGTGSVNDFENFTLYHEGQMIAGPITGDENTQKITFNFNPALIITDKNATLELKGTVSNEATASNESYFQIKAATDIDSNLNEYGVFPINGNLFTIGDDGSEEKAKIIVTNKGPEPTYIPQGSQEAELLNFSIKNSLAKESQVKNTKLIIELKDPQGNAVDPNLDNQLYDMLKNPKIIDLKSNATIVGPAVSVTKGQKLKNGYLINFSEDYDFNGNERNLSVQIDVAEGIPSDYQVRATIEYGAESIKDIMDNFYYLPSDIAIDPAIGNWMTIGEQNGDEFKVTLSDEVASQTTTPGEKDVKTIALDFETGSKAVELTELNLNFFGNDTDNDWADEEGNLPAHTIVTFASLYNEDQLLGTASLELVNVGGGLQYDSGIDYYKVNFDSLDMVIDANSIETLTVKIDVLNTIEKTTYLALGLDPKIDVVAEDKDAKAVQASGEKINLSTIKSPRIEVLK